MYACSISRESYSGVVYQSLDPTTYFEFTIDESKSLIENLNSATSSFDNLDTLSKKLDWLNISVETTLFKNTNADFKNHNHYNRSPYSAWVRSFPLETISSIPEPTLNDLSKEGRDFIFFIENYLPNSEYIGNGEFLVTIDTNGLAVKNGNRASSFGISAVIKTMNTASARAGITSGAGTAAAVAMNKWADDFTYRQDERNRNLSLISQLSSEVCAPGSSTTEECRACVMESSAYQNEMEGLKDARNTQLGVAGSSIAVACGVGAAVGAFFAGVGAPVGCALGAIGALFVSAAEAFQDHMTYKNNISETNRVAFNERDRIIGDDISLGEPDIGEEIINTFLFPL